jgi:CheY-like chemotaxis protein
VSQTILIVDDCADIARIIARYLESAGFRTLTATSGPAAREVLAKTTPDCIILDLMMPGMSGTELLHALRADETTRDIPVILASARIGHGTHFRSTIDADYSVGKPFTRQQIIHAVRSVLARRAGADPGAHTAMPPSRVEARIAAQHAPAGLPIH